MARSNNSKALLVAVVVGLSSCSAAMAQSNQPTNADRSTIRGEIERISCEIQLENGKRRYNDCDINCKAKENAVGLMDSRGKIFVLLDASGRDSKEAAKRLDQQVSVTGRVMVEENSAPVIFVDMIH